MSPDTSARTYGETDQYKVRGAFLGPLKLGGRLALGHEDAVGDWRTQLTDGFNSTIPSETPVWVLVDNAYYRGEVIVALDTRGWNSLISVTDR